MHPFPHVYTVSASGAPSESIATTAAGLPPLDIAPPMEFDGPGDRWSPETLLCAAVADCFILTFRAVARVAKLEWRQLECKVEGTLERVDGVTQFTKFLTHATLYVTGSAQVEHCKALLEKAERSCLVSSSLRAIRTLDARIVSQ